MTIPGIDPEDVTRRPDEPGLTADAEGSVGDRMEPIGANLEQSGDPDGDRRGYTSSNQARTEAMPTTPGHGTQPGGAAHTLSDPEPRGEGGTTTPPDTTLRTTMAGGVPAAAVSRDDLESVPGEAGSGDAAMRPAVAQPGKPDGEVDTRL
jgi:hypothetical protein